MRLVLPIIIRDLYAISNICNSCFVISSRSSGNYNGYKWLIRYIAPAGEYIVTKVNLISINRYPTVTISRKFSGKELAKLTNMSFKTFGILNPLSINSFVSLTDGICCILTDHIHLNFFWRTCIIRDHRVYAEFVFTTYCSFWVSAIRGDQTRYLST